MMGIVCDRGIANELSDYFSFYVPGYKYMPAYKNKVWDGKIRLYNTISGELNAGLFEYVQKFCTERSYSYIIEPTDYGTPGEKKNVSMEVFDGFIPTLKLPFEMREYQKETVLKALTDKRAVLLSPTGSGKSLIIYVIMRYLIDSSFSNAKALIIVPTTSLVEQMYNDFKDYGYNVENNVHKIYSGKEKDFGARVVVSTWQSIHRLPKKWFDQFSIIIGDECHGFKSKSLSSIMNKATEAEYRFGTTGTLDGTQTHRLVLEGLFGPVYQVTTTKKLQDDDTLAPLDIKVLLLDYSTKTKEDFGIKTYQKEIEFIVSHERRNKFIRNLALNQSGNSLVLFHYVEKHGKVLFDLIQSKAEEGRKVFYVSGETDTTDREAIRKIVESQSNAIIVASLGTFSTGINIRNLHNIIFASPSKSQIKVLQSIGRGLRKSDDGSTTKLFDIADDLHTTQKPNFTLLHSAERVKIYQKEQFQFEIIKVDIEESWKRID
jgi:superfamily II DNA or RNA helicase